MSVSSSSSSSGDEAAAAPKTRDFATTVKKGKEKRTNNERAMHTIPIKAAKEPLSVWARMKAFPKIGGKA